MNTVLEAVKSTRSELPDSLGSCASVDSDLGVLQQVVKERQDQAEQAKNVQTSGLTDGDALKQAMVDMTQGTLDADQDYLDWAQQAQSSGDCTDVEESGEIGDANQKAADAKRQFVALWNPIAQQSNQPSYAWNDF